ncbi:MAG: C2H2-type zinc finger protein [Thermodesulfobacteriota bacterium]
MFGYDSIIVLPILLIFAAFAGLIAMVLTAYSEAISRSCKVCGVEFMGNRDLKSHMKDHARAPGTTKPVSKGNLDKAA